MDLVFEQHGQNLPQRASGSGTAALRGAGYRGHGLLQDRLRQDEFERWAHCRDPQRYLIKELFLSWK